MSELIPGIPVTNEFDDCIPPEDDGTGFCPPPEFYTNEPVIAYTGDQIPNLKPEDFKAAVPEPKKKAGRPAGKKQELVSGDAPAWWNGKSIDTTTFCEEFLKTHDIKCINGTFFTPDGIYPIEKLRKEIYFSIKNLVRNYPTQTASNIIENLKTETLCDTPLIDENVINLRDGTMWLDTGKYTDEKQICRNRLPSTCDLAGRQPIVWLKFVNELLEPEDVETLQEFMGYCLIPSTKAQKMLIIIGNGGEGKSRIGTVMRSLLGDNMNYGSIPKLETNSFARADLEHKLLMVDDDMRLESLPTTANLKALITSEGLMDLERKGVQSYQGVMYCRLMAFSNGYLKSGEDDSWGFFRRQLILMTKPRPEDRKDDPYLSEKLAEERDMIFIWALKGLYRLIKNDFRFTESAKSKAAVKVSMDESNNVISFMHSKGCFTYDPEGEITSKALYNLYKGWCDDNAVEAVERARMINYVRSHCHEYRLKYCQIPYQYKRVRGFKGMRPGLATPINPVASA